ncbi:unnamed protein product, partial [marine sediment metagenome]
MIKMTKKQIAFWTLIVGILALFLMLCSTLKAPEKLINQEKVLLTLRYAYLYKSRDGKPFKNASEQPRERSRPVLENDIVPIDISNEKRLYFGVWNGNEETLLNTQ